MKSVVITLLFFCCILIAQGQLSPVLVYEQYHAAKTPDEKTIVLNSYFNSISEGTFSERIATLLKTQDYFTSKDDLWGTGFIQLGIATGFRVTGQYSASLTYSLPALKKFEAVNDTAAIVSALMQIGSSFTESQNIQQGLNYYKKCKTLIEARPDKEDYATVLNNMADCYNQLNQPDSALLLMKHVTEIAEQQQDSALLVNYYSRIGESYLLKNDAASARIYFWKSILYNGRRTYRYEADICNDLAAAHFMSATYDSALYYAQQAAQNAYPDYKKELMTAYKWQYKTYEREYHPDSANKYYRLSMDLKDSLFNSEKNSSIILMDFREQERQEEIAVKKIKEAAERHENMEYILISLGILLTVGLFLLLTRRFIVNIKVIKAFGVITLLIVFEFFNLLLHPLLEQITHHSIFLMLSALVMLAAILAPLHHKAEHWATKILIEKNNRLRSAAAKKST